MAPGQLGYAAFPGSLGKYSTIRKNKRLLGELNSHLSMSVSISRTILARDVLYVLNHSLLQLLRKNDVVLSSVY